MVDQSGRTVDSSPQASFEQYSNSFFCISGSIFVYCRNRPQGGADNDFDTTLAILQSSDSNLPAGIGAAA
jgi:hypothetical protein